MVLAELQLGNYLVLVLPPDPMHMISASLLRAGQQLSNLCNMLEYSVPYV